MGKPVIRLGRYTFDTSNLTVEPYIFVFTFAIHLFHPVFQALLFRKICMQTYNLEFCDEMKNNLTAKRHHMHEFHKVTSDTSHWIMYNNIVLLVPSFFTVTLFWGPFSDKFGRKATLMLAPIGELLNVLSCLLNSIFIDWPVDFLLIGTFLHGVCGGKMSNIMASNSYVAHVSKEKGRIMRFGLLESMFMLSGTVGGFVSGVMLDNEGYVFVFSCMTICIVIAMMYVLLWLDNVGANTEKKDSGCCDKTLDFFKTSYRCIARKREPKVFASLLILVLATNLISLSRSGVHDVQLLYLRENLDFSQTIYGYYNGAQSFVHAAFLLTCLPLIKRYTKLGDLQIAMIGIISNIAQTVFVGVSTTQTMVFCSALLGVLSPMTSAGLRAVKSGLVYRDETGRLFGISGAVEAVISLLASLLFNELYPETVHIFPGMCHLIAAGIILPGFFMILYVHLKLPTELPSKKQKYALSVEEAEKKMANGQSNGQAYVITEKDVEGSSDQKTDNNSHINVAYKQSSGDLDDIKTKM